MAQGIVFGDKKSNKVYGPGDAIPLSAVKEPAVIQNLTGWYATNPSAAILLGLDQTYAYLKLNGTQLAIYNRVTKSLVYGADGMLQNITGAISSNNDGFVYMFSGATNVIKKINCATGATVWSHTLAYTISGFYCIKYYQGYVYVVWNNGSVVELEKIDPSTGALVGTTNGILGQNATNGVIYDQYFYCFYNTNFYKYDITTGNQVQVWSGGPTTLNAVDFLNQVYFTLGATNVVCNSFNKTQKWSYNPNFTYVPTPFLVTKTGYFLNDYNSGVNLKLTLNGSLMYTQYNPTGITFTSSGTSLLYMYELDEIWFLLAYTLSSNNTYFNLGKFIEKLTLS